MPSRRIEGPDASEVLKSAALRAEEIKQALRAEIRQRGLSERDLADELGFGPTYLTNLFVTSPGRTPTALKLETLLALLEMLDIELLEFVGRLKRIPARHSKGGPRRGGTTRALGRKDYELFRELLGVEKGERSDHVRDLAERTIDFVKRHSAAPKRRRPG